MRWNYRIFLIGVLLITLLSATILLLIPDENHNELLPIFKLMMGIWILRAILSVFGHRIS